MLCSMRRRCFVARTLYMELGADISFPVVAYATTFECVHEGINVTSVMKRSEVPGFFLNKAYIVLSIS